MGTFWRTRVGDCVTVALFSAGTLCCASPTQGDPPLRDVPREQPWRSPESWYICESDECDGDVTRPLSLDANPDWSGAIFRLERRRCYGACPEYRVSLYPDGRVEYEGLDHVGVCGRRVARTSPAERERLVRTFQAEAFLTTNLVEPTQGPLVTDQDTVVTIVEIAGARRLAWHYGPRFYGPRLTRLEALVDEVTGTERWTTCPRDECRCLPTVEEVRLLQSTRSQAQP